MPYFAVFVGTYAPTIIDAKSVEEAALRACNLHRNYRWEGPHGFVVTVFTLPKQGPSVRYRFDIRAPRLDIKMLEE